MMIERRTREGKNIQVERKTAKCELEEWTGERQRGHVWQGGEG